MLKATNVNFQYSKGKTVLKSVSLTLSDQRTIMLGPNGAGKSTLLNVLAGNIQPHAGQVKLIQDGNHTLPSNPRSQFTRAVGWLPQHTRAIAGLRVREQVAYAGWLKGLTRQEAWDAALPALERVDMATRSTDLASRLSGGQLRRVAIAQCLVHGSQVLLLDEPTAGLDPREVDRFNGILTALPVDVSILVSTHDVTDIEEVFEKVIVLNDGRIVFSGPVDEFVRLGEPGLSWSRKARSAYSSLISARRASA